MLAERYLKRRYQEGRKEGREEGLEKGREEGREEERVAWEAWNQRREQFEVEHPGERFTEPPPSRSVNGAN